jgi:hypothetical protein
MDETENREDRFPKNGTAILPEGEKLKHAEDIDAGIEYLRGPEINAGPLGKVSLKLDRYIDEEPDQLDNQEVYTFKNGKISTTDRYIAEKDGYSLTIKAVQSVIPQGLTLRCTLWSEEDNFVVSSIAKRNPENEGIATDLDFLEWSIDGNEPRSLVVSGNPEFATKLKFNIETIQQIPNQGGENL